MVDVANLCMGCMELRSSGSTCALCSFKEGTDPESPLHLRPRTELHGQYLVGKVLGHGGFGITYLGWDLNLERKIAIKEYLPSGVAVRTGLNSEVIPFSGEMRKDFEYGLERYLDEARTVARFQTHPSIVSVLNFFRANGTAYLVMEYLDGATFERFLESSNGKTAIDMVLTVMVPVMEALHSVHQQGVLHRDISPDNIYITRKWAVKVLDFGAARYALGQKSRNLSVILKEGYAPVEQYHSKGNQGPWTDVYGCAATMYRALTGKVPPASLDRMQADDLVAPSAMGIDISLVQEQSILRALAVQPNARFTTMEAFKNAITGAGPLEPLAETGEKIPAASVSGLQSIPVTGPRISSPDAPVINQQQTRVSGLPVPPPVSEARPISRVPQKAPVPRWVWAAAGGMLVAVLAIAGWKSYDDRQKLTAALAQQEATRLRQEQERQAAEKAIQDKIEEDRKRRAAEDAELQKQQQELDRANQELEDKRNAGKKTVVPRPTPPPQQSPQQSQQAPGNTRSGPGTPQGQTIIPPQGGPRPTGPPQVPSSRAPEQSLADRLRPPAEAPGASYDDLLRQAANFNRARNYSAAIQANQQAIKINPARPDAYANIGWIALYGTGDIQTAVVNYKEAIKRGGIAYFQVSHDHQNMTYQDRCEGNLGIGSNSLEFTSSIQLHNFKAAKSEVKEVKPNKWNPLRGGARDDFHVELKDKRNLNLMSATHPKLVREMIFQLLQ